MNIVEMKSLLKRAKGFTNKLTSLDAFETTVSKKVERTSDISDFHQNIQELYEAVSALLEAMEQLDNAIYDISNEHNIEL